ncbi:S9 family peptidase [Arthrobacter sp. UYEF3]|uniref:S9 family peptidase n=1 Tax=Arthrobacter sp. UYEF3 TaxID=1756365 RepID=UPI0033948F3E
MKSEHLPLLKSVSAPAVHPDGSRAVVSVLRPDFDADAYVGQLWNVPVDPASPPRRLTRGFRDTSPGFSPDGQVLAFLRAEPGGKPQLHIVEAAGGEPVPVTDAPLGVSAFTWSPDSQNIVFSARTPEDGRYGTVDGVSAGGEDARLITDYKYRMNGVGYTADKPLQLFVVAAPALDEEPKVAPAGRAVKAASAEAGGKDAARLPAARQLTTAATDHEGASYSTDGKSVYFTAALHEGSDGDLASGIYRIAVDPKPGDAAPEPIAQANAGRQSVSAVRQSRDGEWLYFAAEDLGPSGRDFVARNTALYVLPARGGDAVLLSDAETHDLGGNPLELRGADGVLVLNNHRGTVQLMEFGPAGQRSVLVDGDRVVTGAAEGGGSLLLSFADAGTAGDVAVLEGGRVRVASDFSAPLRGAGIIAPQELTFASADGYPVHGWLVKPEVDGPCPVLLNIHGGPFAQFTGALFDEAQVYAAAGYAVLMCNPRGSAGYGQAHGRIIKERMGTVDMQDVVAFLDGALEKFEELDGDALGIMGGSYGGYLTAWTISHDHRFKGAIVERGFLDPVSFTGSSDIGWFFGGEYTGLAAEQMAAQSPMARVDHVRTPTLVIHSEDDLRCPVEQGQRYFTALKQLGVEAAFLVFPGENHELSRSGTPHHRRQRFDQVLKWWSRHLPTAANPAPVG